MAYDEVSFLNGIILGRAMKGFGMANPNRGNLLRVQAMHLATAPWIYLRPGTLPVFQDSSLTASSLEWDLNGETLEAFVSAPAALGFGGLSASVELTPDSEEFSAEADFSGGLTDVIGAELRQKAPDLSLRVPGMPEGLGSTLTAAGTITIDE